MRLIIPAAGNGTRLGDQTTPKALVQFCRGTLIGHIIGEIGFIFDRIVIVIKPGLRQSFIRTLSCELSENLLAKIYFAEQSEPSGSLDAVLSGLEAGETDSAIVVWCDQVGVSQQTINEIVSLLDLFDVAIPYVEMKSPYVWLEISDELVTKVGRSRDGDETPKIGAADLGVFGLSNQALQNLATIRRELSRTLGKRELDFTYALPFLTRNFPTKLIPNSSEKEALAVNSKLELKIAEEVLCHE